MIERAEAEAIQMKGIQRERYGDNSESGSRGYTGNGNPGKGDTAAI